VPEDVAAAAFAGTVTPVETDAVVVPAVPEEELASPSVRRVPFGVVFWICCGWLAILVLSAIFAPVLHLQNPNPLPQFLTSFNASVSRAHWLGTDNLGRDNFSRLVYGARVSLVIGVGATAIGMVVGGSLGMLAAYVRGRFDAGLSFFMYCGLAFPAIVAVIAILDFWGQSESHIILVLGLFSVPLIYRLIRAATLTTATKEYITAAKSQGATAMRVLFHDIFPSVAPSFIVYGVFTLGGIIAIEGALAFLGLSVPIPTPSWGNVISDASNDPEAPLVFLVSPAIALFLTLVSLYYVGERIRVHFDPGEVKL
jgi:peptide/nickel transport system permease protein